MTVDTPALGDLRDVVVEKLEVANYPVGDVVVLDRASGASEIVARLIGTTVDPKELDAVADALERQAGVRHATWEASTRD